MLPRSLASYVLFDFIGRGGMAEIYLARQKMQLGGTRLCVVKEILPALAEDPQFSEMLVHEAKLAARLSHVNIVEVLHLGRAEGRLFIAMEYVEGFDLNELLGRCSRARVRLPAEFALYILTEALRGLDYAHRRKDDAGNTLGVVHRDVSPSNVLLSFDGQVKVCDFGIARANGNIVPGQVGNVLGGKARYMSPEHARGEGVDARADVFAAGIVLWELAAGRRMYMSADGAAGLLELARRADVPELPSRGWPEEQSLRAVLGKALAVDREQRYRSARAMLRDLEAYGSRAKLRTSALSLGQWLTATFGEEVIARRRARERAVAALERGAPLVIEPIAPIALAPTVVATRAARPMSKLAFVAAALATLGAAVLANAMR
jgi:eukaryotic-like serine/threonine-protein kinase